MSTPIGRLRFVGKLEGASFLLLLGVAMPLKYLADLPMAVRVVGMAHGVLFIAFGFVLFQALASGALSMRRAAVALMAAFLPFGPFVIDRSLRDDEASAAPEVA